MTTVRQMYEALEEMLETNGGDDVFIASQPSWPLQNQIAEVRRVEFVEDHPFEYSEDYRTEGGTMICAICGQHAEHDDHQMAVRIYVVEGSPCEDTPYLPDEAQKELGW